MEEDTGTKMVLDLTYDIYKYKGKSRKWAMRRNKQALAQRAYMKQGLLNIRELKAEEEKNVA